MPYQWFPPELFTAHKGVAVYHCYTSQGRSLYWYTTDPYDDDVDQPSSTDCQFNLRDLPGLGLDLQENKAVHRQIIHRAIDEGLITGPPSRPLEPQIVTIEVVGEAQVTVIEKPVVVEVKVIRRSVAAKEE
jgi:hypothetical protein